MYITGKIDSSSIGQFKNLEYKNKSFNDLNAVKRWKEIGHIYEKYTGLLIDQSSHIPSWCANITDEFDLKYTTTTLYCMTPGTILPNHKDIYLKYKEIFSLDENFSNIYRVIIFLEDWKSGHYLEVDETPIVSWKKGDYVMWKYDSEHIAANIGSENRYTLQVTGIKND
jgi:hypothetical protein